jgi:predicted HTH domain antitoxin
MLVTVELPEPLVANASEAERDVLEAVAIQAYAQRRISQGKLAELLGLNTWQSENLLARRGIVRPFTTQDFEHELTNLNQARS